MELDPNQGMALQNLSTVLRDQGKYSEAETVCARAVELSPDSIEVYHLYAEMLKFCVNLAVIQKRLKPVK